MRIAPELALRFALLYERARAYDEQAARLAAELREAQARSAATWAARAAIRAAHFAALPNAGQVVIDEGANHPVGTLLDAAGTEWNPPPDAPVTDAPPSATAPGDDAPAVADQNRAARREAGRLERRS